MPSGGARAGAGRPRKSLSSRIDEGIGKVKHSKPKVLDYPPKNQNNIQNPDKKNQKSKLDNIPTFLQMASKESGDDLPSALDIYKQTLAWIVDAGCERFVTKQLVEDFAFTRRSYLEAEFMAKKLGRVFKDNNGVVRPSPYVKHSLEYAKVMTSLYREIQSIITQNSTKDYDGKTSQDNEFLRLLMERGF